MAEIRDAIKGLDGIIQIAENARGIGPSDIRSAVEEGIPDAQKLARKYLAQNYRRSGLKVRTGELLGMIKRSVLSLTNAGTKRISLVLSMPAGKTKKDYQKANALNYGAVRRPADSVLNARGATGRRIVGDKRLANLKSKVQNGKASESFTQIGADLGVRVSGKTKAGSVEVDTTLGKATVTKAWKYFQITNAQLDEIRDLLFNGALEALTAKITGQKRQRKAA